MGRISVLDGWRGISILAVLACHLLPLGPKSLRLNEMAGPFGMALFFCLSGFLITRFLLNDQNVIDFGTRRLLRIVPLAWTGSLVALAATQAPASAYLPHLLFYANVTPSELTPMGAHLWSLGVEVQFYVAIGIVVWLFGWKGLYLAAPACILITLNRIHSGAYVDISTLLRVDEILVGALLCLAVHGKLGAAPSRLMKFLDPRLLLVLLLISSHPSSGPLNYARPYLAALLIGSSLYGAPEWLEKLLASKTLNYIAAISFALYVVHPLVAHIPLFQSENPWIRYALRLLLFPTVFAISHLSTFYFEQPLMQGGKRWLRMRLNLRASDPSAARM